MLGWGEGGGAKYLFSVPKFPPSTFHLSRKIQANVTSWRALQHFQDWSARPRFGLIRMRTFAQCSHYAKQIFSFEKTNVRFCKRMARANLYLYFGQGALKNHYPTVTCGQELGTGPENAHSDQLSVLGIHHQPSPANPAYSNVGRELITNY